MGNFCALSTRERRFGYRDFYFPRLFPGFMCRVLTSRAFAALVASPSKGDSAENSVLQQLQALASCPWQAQDQTEIVPSFHPIAETEWSAGKSVFFGRVKMACVPWKPGSAKPARQSPLPVVDNSETFALSTVHHQNVPSIVQEHALRNVLFLFFFRNIESFNESEELKSCHVCSLTTMKLA